MGRRAVEDSQPRARAPADKQQRFDELGLIGEGSYGVVVKARDRQTGRLVALKKFLDSTLDSTTQRELEALRRLNGTPGVCALVASYTDSQAGGHLRIAMEYVGGGSLLDQLKAHPRGLPWTRARAIVRSLCEAVGDMHVRGVMHRDLKPENVLLCDERVQTLALSGGLQLGVLASRNVRGWHGLALAWHWLAHWFGTGLDWFGTG